MKNNTQKVNIENEEEYIKWCRSIAVDTKINQFNPLINKHNSEIEIRKAKEKNKFKDYLPFSVQYRLKYERHSENSAVLNIDVSDEHRNRAYRFMHCFIEMIQALGGTVFVDSRNNDNIVIRFPYGTFECSLVEKRGKYRDIKLKDTKTMRPLYDTINTGKFIFKIYTVNKGVKQQDEIVYDEENLSLNDQVADMFIAIRPILIDLIKESIELENKQEKEYEQRKLKWEKEKKEEEQKKQKENKIKQQSIISKHIEKWEQLKSIEAYVNEIKSYGEGHADGEVKELIEKYCDYVLGIFDKNDFYIDIIEFIQQATNMDDLE
ncbi:hypothetical protein EDC19_2539 [Natranaerovirga hydrolytica]|uniref:Uncharacterized protein n=1 Tax=Natranaerovirga hydrolytica TaxID=680378 RepID=A0A4R1MDL2_9FIRM|nr:hypothetical protein [Natranaerovirga hydrolytica]TCK89124.1 hypothetical protein EDC19_2539 [Natranaerovirga hydrolytica]